MYPTNDRRNADPLSTIFPMIIIASTFVFVLLASTVASFFAAHGGANVASDRPSLKREAAKTIGGIVLKSLLSRRW